MSLDIKCTQHENDVCVITVDGEITFENSDRFRDQIDKCCDDRKYKLVINLEHLQYMSSAGMGVLVHGLKKTRAHSGDVRIANLTDKMHRVFLVTQFTHHFQIFASVNEAIKSFAPKNEG